MKVRARSHFDEPLVDLDRVDLDTAEHVTYVLRQSFRYDYDGPAADLRHRLVVVPRMRHGSLRRRVSNVRVSAPEAVVRRRRDCHGNPVVDVRLALVPPYVEFTMAAVLIRSGGYQDAQVGSDACRAPAHLRPSALTAPDSALRDLAGWGPHEITTLVTELDLRVGGSYRFSMQPPDGDLFRLSGQFLEIHPPSHLVYTFRWEEPTPDDRDTVGTLSLDAAGDATAVHLTQGEFATEERRALHRDGWTDSFEKSVRPSDRA